MNVRGLGCTRHRRSISRVVASVLNGAKAALDGHASAGRADKAGPVVTQPRIHTCPPSTSSFEAFVKIGKTARVAASPGGHEDGAFPRSGRGPRRQAADCAPPIAAFSVAT